MIALDTNVLARLVTRDDPQQARAAAALIDEGETCFVPLPVAIELERVLRGVYVLAPDEVAESFSAAETCISRPDAAVQLVGE